MTRPGYDFEYAPVDHGGGDDDGASDAVVVATRSAIGEHELRAALKSAGDRPLPELISVTASFERAPLFWYRLDFAAAVVRAHVAEVLARGGVEARYVASVHRGTTALGASLDEGAADVWPDERWAARREPVAELRRSDAFWFLHEGEQGAGVNVIHDGRHVHDGRGTRLAVIDDDGESAAELALDAEIPVGITQVPRSHSHGPQMVAWAVGARGARPMAGVAPAASPRLYVIPKPGTDVLSLAVALARAVADGADVVLCATYVEGASSPMLGDALHFAVRHGRGGLGTAVVLPTGREASSPSYAARASWSLSLADPACDPRVFCIAPGGRDGGWFTWKDRRGAFHPFGNRGPQVRWSAPGDDMAYPFGTVERTHHGESSGASAIAAGVLLCVLGANPALRWDELDAVITRTAANVGQPENARLHRSDAAPVEVDSDGHNAKQGYGRMDARAACAAVTCPVAGALVAIGDHSAATRWLRLRESDPRLAALVSGSLSGWLARVALADSGVSHALRSLVRHLRLVAARPERSAAQVDGAILRFVVLSLEAALFSRSGPAATPRIRRELVTLRDQLVVTGHAREDVAAFERDTLALARELFFPAHARPACPSGTRLRAVSSVGAHEVGHEIAKAERQA
jgi:hypothetical protein